jgi:hypothetical protein
VPEQQHRRPGEAKVTRFADLRADRDAREREILRNGLAAAVDAVYEWTRPGQDVRVVVVAMYGDPYAGDDERPEAGHSVPVEARFLSLDDARPLTDAQRRYLALETMRAASEPLFREMSLGLRLVDRLEQLSAAGNRGDAQAKTRYELIIAALKSEEHESEDGDPTTRSRR